MKLRRMLEWLGDSTNFVPIALLIVALIVTTCARDAWPAPRVRSDAQCRLFGDMALVARALAEEEAADKLAHGVLYRVYDLGERPERVEMAGLLMAQARKSKLSAGDYAGAFVAICLIGGGKVDTFFDGSL